MRPQSLGIIDFHRLCAYEWGGVVSQELSSALSSDVDD